MCLVLQVMFMPKSNSRHLQVPKAMFFTRVEERGEITTLTETTRTKNPHHFRDRDSSVECVAGAS